MTKTFKEHADEAQMTEADRIAHAATWDAAVKAAVHAIECTHVVAGREWHAGTALALQEELIATIGALATE